MKLLYLLDEDVMSRLYDKTVRKGECLEWTGALKENGYGVINVKGIPKSIHRTVYVWSNQEDIPEGLEIDHLCMNRKCVEITHLEAVSSRENTLRSPNTRASINKSRTHCPQGHEYTEENLVPSALKKGGRACKICMRERSKVTTAKRKAERESLGMTHHQYLDYKRALKQRKVAV